MSKKTTEPFVAIESGDANRFVQDQQLHVSRADDVVDRLTTYIQIYRRRLAKTSIGITRPSCSARAEFAIASRAMSP